MRILLSCIILSSVLAIILTGVHAQGVVVDDKAEAVVINPQFQPSAGPVVAIDSGHKNYHTARGRYAPFASLLRNDGFKVVALSGEFSTQALSGIRLLVVANALHIPEVDVKDWNASQPSALDPKEINAVTNWVRRGGSLLIIADHRPFAGSIESLASAFGFEFSDELAERNNPSTESNQDIFTVASGTLKGNEILSGRNDSEKITSVQTFAGSAFHIPPSAQPVIVLPHGYSLFSCGLPCPKDAAKHPADGYYQGAVLKFGSGKVAVFGEAAMFSAQTVTVNGQHYYFGFNAPTAPQNKQFILNLIGWLVSPSSLSH